MIDDFDSEPQSSGALVPAPLGSTTALTAPAPLPLNERRAAGLGETLQELVETTLDTLDDLGDRIAGAVGLR
jgi:hypothetical protein